MMVCAVAYIAGLRYEQACWARSASTGGPVSPATAEAPSNGVYVRQRTERDVG